MLYPCSPWLDEFKIICGERSLWEAGQCGWTDDFHRNKGCKPVTMTAPPSTCSGICLWGWRRWALWFAPLSHRFWGCHQVCRERWRRPPRRLRSDTRQGHAVPVGEEDSSPLACRGKVENKGGAGCWSTICECNLWARAEISCLFSPRPRWLWPRERAWMLCRCANGLTRP